MTWSVRPRKNWPVDSLCAAANTWWVDLYCLVQDQLMGIKEAVRPSPPQEGWPAGRRDRFNWSAYRGECVRRPNGRRERERDIWRVQPPGRDWSRRRQGECSLFPFFFPSFLPSPLLFIFLASRRLMRCASSSPPSSTSRWRSGSAAWAVHFL